MGRKPIRTFKPKKLVLAERRREMETTSRNSLTKQTFAQSLISFKLIATNSATH